MPQRDHAAVAEAVKALLAALGKTDDPNVAETPELVAKAWCDELLEGEAMDPLAVLEESSIEVPPSAGLVTLRDIAVTSMCPHHLLPSLGTADVVYLPAERVAGFGAIARAVHAATRRLTLQETAGQDIVNALQEGLAARGALCRLRLIHTCLVARGARATGTTVETIALGGSFADDASLQAMALGSLRS